MRHLVAMTLAALVLAPAAFIKAQADVIVHDLAAIAFNVRGSLQLKSVVTEDGSIGLAVARAGVTQAGHHHEQEQVVLPIDVAMEFSIAGVAHPLPPFSAAIPPSNTRHFYVTAPGEPATFIEYQPVRRDDWQPPFPPNKSALSPQPLPLPPGRTVTRDLSAGSPGWSVSGVARTKEFAGDQIKVVMFELKGRGTIRVPAAAAGRQFVYVLTGAPSLAVGPASRELAPHAVIEMRSSARPIVLAPPRDGTSMVAVFSRMPR